MNKKIITCLCSSVFTVSLFIAPLTANASTTSNIPATNYEDVTKSEKKLKLLQEEVINSLSSDQINFYKYVEKVKAQNTNLSTEEIVAIIDWTILEKANLEKENSDKLKINSTISLLSEEEGSSLADSWNRLRPAEKTLVVLHPAAAVIVKGCQQTTDEYTMSVWGSHKDGEKTNAYRHAMWNALMVSRLNDRQLAKLFATAHEEVPTAALSTSWLGFTGQQHKTMDLHNNAKGRDCVAWNDLYPSAAICSFYVINKIYADEMIILIK